ncbi:ABC transporter permease [Athalassotoga saccharophila]|uniref:ABC transporter permease n=1 Tax=Athalassotoga saccharophila TaxID=1441386 RepID=UPI00137B9173|nr:ABC transporter permease [Athalassotoga saccharophila]BBJ28499.1 putative multidrug ABC transporter permease YbhS [Athalassotoga saccharophila]
MIYKSFVMLFRDRQALLMFFLLPIVLMFILGFVIEGLSGSKTAVNVKIGAFTTSPELERMITQAASGSGVEFEFVGSEEALNRLLLSGNVQMGAILGQNSLTFIYNQSFGQYNNYLKILQDVIAGSVVSGISNVKNYIQLKPISVESGSLTVIGFIVPGVIAISITIAGMFGMAIITGNYRQNGILKRLSVTPVKGGTFFLSLAFVRFIISVLASVLTILLSEWFFSTSYNVNWPMFLLFVSSGIFLSLGIGLLISMISRDLWTILNITTILSVTMMLFSDVFFPYSIMPDYMRIISHILPISYFAQGLRYTLGIEAMYTNDFIIITSTFILIGLGMISVGGTLIMKMERR